MLLCIGGRSNGSWSSDWGYLIGKIIPGLPKVIWEKLEACFPVERQKGWEYEKISMCICNSLYDIASYIDNRWNTVGENY
jgi:hypothetical protein